MSRHWRNFLQFSSAIKKLYCFEICTRERVYFSWEIAFRKNQIHSGASSLFICFPECDYGWGVWGSRKGAIFIESRIWESTNKFHLIARRQLWQYEQIFVFLIPHYHTTLVLIEHRSMSSIESLERNWELETFFVVSSIEHSSRDDERWWEIKKTVSVYVQTWMRQQHKTERK